MEESTEKIKFGDVVRPMWYYASDREAYPTAVVTGAIFDVQGSNDVRFAVILLPSSEAVYPMEWRCYMSEVEVLEKAMTMDEVTALYLKIRGRYERTQL